MTLGPVHLVVIGLQNDRMKGQVARELQAASQSGVIRVLDALAILKTQDGKVISLGASDLSPDERVAYGSVVGALMGFGATGTEEGAEAGAEIGAVTFAEHNFGLSREDIQGIAKDIPPGATAVMVLFEHRWAVPLKEAIEDAGGIVLAQGIVRPETLIGLGANLAASVTAANQIDTASGMQAN
jgi:uncharacterized membrane protein